MTNNHKVFVAFNDSKQSHIKLANGEHMASLGIRDGFIQYHVADEVKKIPVKNVMFVPNLENNLLSIKQLKRQSHTLTFKDDCCAIANSNTVLAEDKLDRDLYKLVCS